MFFYFVSCTTPTTTLDPTFSVSNAEPIWDEEDLLSKLDQALTYGIPSSLAVRNAYVEALSFRDNNCPALLAADTVIGTWEGGCSSPSHRYYGTGIFIEIEDSAPDLPYEMALQSSFEIEDSLGNKFISGGITTRLEMNRDNEYLIEESIGGTYKHDAMSGWFQVGVTTSLKTERAVENQGARGYLDGGIGYPELAINFSMLQYDTSECSSPFGDFSIRDPSGYWFHATFEDCSGCAILTWNQSSIGTLCAGSILMREIDRLYDTERE